MTAEREVNKVSLGHRVLLVAKESLVYPESTDYRETGVLLGPLVRLESRDHRAYPVFLAVLELLGKRVPLVAQDHPAPLEMLARMELREVTVPQDRLANLVCLEVRVWMDHQVLLVKEEPGELPEAAALKAGLDAQGYQEQWDLLVNKEWSGRKEILEKRVAREKEVIWEPKEKLATWAL